MDSLKVEILKLKINKGGLHSVIELAKKLIDNNEKFYVCAPNAYVTVIANENKELLDILNNARVVIPDGMPLVWYSRTFKKALPERICGFDFFYNFSKIANREGYSYFLIGGESENILKKIKKKIEDKFCNVVIKGYFCPPFMDNFTEKVNNEIIATINKCKPDILWVGLSAPKQEKWIYKNIDKLNVKMVCGIGAVFNFYSGYIKRAPTWMQRVGLEWFFRIISEPKRLFKKYLIYNTKFIMLVFKDILRRILKTKKHGN